jgi:SAM-dependent methyltransferase
LSVEHWENYYRGGALATCPVGPAPGYTLELRDVWEEFFRGLPPAARILDIGTGNGAIALIAKEAAGAIGRHYEIHGTDLAQIDPARDVKDGVNLFAGITFHASVPTEQLPFPAAAFDAVSGQYALEYTRVEQALGEIHRVLNDGGVAQFVLHHDDSIIVHNARESLKHTDLVLNDTKIFRKLRRHVEAERQSPSTARSTWQDLVAAVTQLQAAVGQGQSALTLRVTVDAVQKLLEARQRLSPAALDRAIDQIEVEVRASGRRLRDLVDCAQSAETMAAMKATAGSVGFVVCELRTQYHARENLVGWRLNLKKT